MNLDYYSGLKQVYFGFERDHMNEGIWYWLIQDYMDALSVQIKNCFPDLNIGMDIFSRY